MLKFGFVLMLAALSAGVLAQSDPEVCVQKLLILAAQLAQFPNVIPKNPDDLAVLLLSGKGIYDLGSKAVCENWPGMHFVLASPQQPAYIGVCIYKECSVQTLNELLYVIAPQLPFPVEFYDNSLNQQVEDRQRSGFIGTCIVLAVLVFSGIVGIAVEYTSLCDKRGLHGIPEDPAKRSDKELVKSKNTGGLLFLAFSFTRNWRKLMSTSGGGGEGYDKNLEVFAGVRTMSMMYVIFGHIELIQFFGSRTDTNQALESKSWFGIFVQGAEYAVDAFFCMAAFLGTYVLLGKLSKSRSICFNFPLAYFHRWYRLIPTLAFVTLLVMYLFPFMVQGPVSGTYYYIAVYNCNKYWWPNFLFINNFYPWELNNECIGQVWYLANDFQFFLITPFLLMLMRLNKSIGYAINILLILLSIMSALVIVYHYDIQLPDGGSDLSDNYYSKPYCRLSAYMVGVLLAQLYYDRKLAKKGDPLSYKSCGNLVFGWYHRSALFSYGSAILGVCITTFLIFFFKLAFTEAPWSLGASMVWTACSRPLFVFGMMLVLLPTFEERLTWLRSFMSCGLFQVVGRLTYSAYLIHITVIAAVFVSTNNTQEISRSRTMFIFFGIYSLSYLAALIITLVSESPILNIEKTLLFPPKAKVEQKNKGFESVNGKINEHSNYQNSDSGVITSIDPSAANGTSFGKWKLEDQNGNSPKANNFRHQ